MASCKKKCDSFLIWKKNWSVFWVWWRLVYWVMVIMLKKVTVYNCKLLRVKWAWFRASWSHPLHTLCKHKINPIRIDLWMKQIIKQNPKRWSADPQWKNSVFPENKIFQRNKLFNLSTNTQLKIETTRDVSLAAPQGLYNSRFKYNLKSKYDFK